MKALYQYLEGVIKQRLPGIKTVSLFNNQFAHSNGQSKTGRDAKSFVYPACFIEFIVEETFNMPLNLVDYGLRIRFRFGVKKYKFDKIETFDFCDDFFANIQGLAPTEASGLTFTTLQLILPEFDEDHNNVELPYLDFRTRFRNKAAYSRRNDFEHGPINPVVTGTVDQIEN